MLRDPLPKADAREILDFLDDRYRRSSCLFATQFPVNQWHQQIQEPTLADAILDRIVHDSLRLGLKVSLCESSPAKLNQLERSIKGCNFSLFCFHFSL